MGGEWGIRVLKDSTAMKDLDFRRMCRLINAFGNVRKRKLRKKILKIYTFEAGMYMKTNKIMTKCPKKVGHFCLSFGHFRLTDTNSAEIRGEFAVAYNNPHGQTPIPDVCSGESSRKVREGEPSQKCGKSCAGLTALRRKLRHDRNFPWTNAGA